jgi:hypothetical protein
MDRMSDRVHTVGLLRRLTIASLGLWLTGCAEELGPVPMRVAHVRGVVREGKRPVSGGWIEFFPVSGTVGNLRSARLRADGSFEADGVAVGENLIRLVNAQIESPLAYRFRSFASPIRRTIPEHDTAPITVDLFEETMRVQRAPRRAAGGDQPNAKES